MEQKIQEGKGKDLLSFIQEAREDVEHFMKKAKSRTKVHAQESLMESIEGNIEHAATIEKVRIQEQINPDAWPKQLSIRDEDLPPIGKDLSGDDILIYCMTWNLMGKAVEDDKMLKVLIPREKYHIYVFGSQESMKTISQSALNPSKKEWESKLAYFLGPNYAMLRGHSLQATHLCIFVHESLRPLLSNIGSAVVATGYRDTLGNKGGVGISFNVGRTTFLFVAAHFTAHQDNASQRNDDFHKIDTQLMLPLGFRPPMQLKRKSSSNWNSVENGYDLVAAEDPRGRASARFDRVFFMGDFNYRIDAVRDDVNVWLLSKRAKDLQKMLEHDQLSKERKKGTVFAGFEEGALNFLPTYKFDIDSNIYDSSKKQRIPSWTDRVLHKTTREGSVEQLLYSSELSIRISDHRPVFAGYKVSIDGVGDPTLIGIDEKEMGIATSQVCMIQ